MNKGLVYLLALLLLAKLSASAQYVEPGTPYSLQHSIHREGRAVRAVDTLRIPAPSFERLRGLRAEDKDAEHRTLRFAEIIPTDISPANVGQWYTDAEGNQRWLLTLRSEGAYSLGLHFSQFMLPEGVKLYAHGKRGVLRGAYTHQNNNDASTLNLAHIPGDVVTLELNVSREIKPSSIKLRLGKVQYAYRNIFSHHGELRASDKFNIKGEPFYNVYGTGLERLRCAPNVVGYPEYRQQARSVLLMVMEGNTMGTGTLINNAKQDGTAYVLTAAHNLNRIYDEEIDSWDKVAEICRSIVFFFGYESPSKDQNIRGTEELTLSGAELIAYNVDADMALLKISGLPKNSAGVGYIPEYYNPYYSGWHLTTSPRSTLYGIHHALASTKRVSIVEDKELKLKDYSIKGIEWIQKHFHINAWSVGTTEAGASGSPLFDGKGLIVAALSGGRSTCNAPYNDSYFSIAQTWDNDKATTSLRHWLDPQNTGLKELQGYDPQSVALSRISNYYAKNNASLKWTTYTAEQGVVGLGRSIHLSNTARPLGVFLLLGEGKALQEGNPNFVISLHPIQDGKPSSEAVWTTKLTHYNYNNYQADSRRFGTQRRTMGWDEVELFVPGGDWANLPTGDYLLSVKTADNNTLDLPLLTNHERITNPQFGRKLWKLNTQGEWTLAPQFTPDIWVDLLVRGSVQTEQPVERSDAPDSPYISYYHDNTVYTYNRGGEAQIKVYSIDGNLWKNRPLGEGENQMDISTLPSGYTYVIYITGKQGKHSYKIIK